MLLFSNYGPYHVARWRAAAQYFAGHGVNLIPLQVADSEEIYPWESKSSTSEVPIVTLFPGKSYRLVSSLSAAYAICRYLKKARICWGAIPGYARPEFLAALLYLRGCGKTAIMMSDSKYDDWRRSRMREWTKGLMVRLFDGALVAGTQAASYAAGLGIAPGRIFPGYDVVDNRFFADNVNRVRSDSDHYRKLFNLPPKYFLSVGRFVPKKNLQAVIKAFAGYRARVGKSGWQLVFCGSGPLESALKAVVQELGLASEVNFYGFRQIGDLPVFYGLAEAFILASSVEEQWGLVVNEAMASGLPVLVSKSCGCAYDLVENGINGFTFDPLDEKGLADLMAAMSSGSLNLEAMGLASQRLISNWPPELFAASLWKAFALSR